MNPQVYTIEEVAEILKVDPRTVRRYIKEGKIQAVKLSAKVVRIPVWQISYLFPDDSPEEVKKDQNK